MKYKCVIFDCDGVLIDSEEISIGTLMEMTSSLGIQLEKDYVFKNFTGKSLKNIFKHIETLSNKKLPDNFEQKFREKTYKAFKNGIKPIKGTNDLLNKISIPYCVASSGPMEKIKLNLTATNLIEKFENRMFSSYEIGSWKPDPEIFEYAAKKMRFRPNECAVIEDSIAGIQAARKGEFDVFGLAKEHNKNSFENEGATIFFEMEKLYDLLQE